MKKILVGGLLFCVSVFIYAETCPCGDTKGENHTRQTVKNRHSGDSDSAVKITFKKLNKLTITDEQIDSIRHNRKLVLPKESAPVYFTGYLMLMKESPDDCDLHMELSFKKDTAEFRIIVEVPNTDEYCELREDIYDQLKSKYDLNKKKKYLFGTASTSVIPKIRVYGFVFFDVAHATLPNHGSRHVQTLWEIHPVFKIEWL